MLGLIIGNVDFAGAVVVVAICVGGTIIGSIFLNRKTPEDYKMEKYKIDKDAEKRLVAYKHNQD